jgi:hypothetical protein
MDERAQNLRLLMKQQQSRTSDHGTSNLSGKDKLKMLKTMKSDGPSSTGVNKVSMQQRVQPPAANATVTHSTSKSSVPSGFYEDEEEQVSVPSSKQSSSIPNKSSPVKESSSLPVGFYDDPEKDMIAQGVSKQAFEKEKEKVITEDFSTFLGEIEQITEVNGLEEAVETEKYSRNQDDEDSALQMAYIMKLAALLKKASETTDKHHESLITKEDEIKLQQGLAEAESMGTIFKVDDSGSQRIMTSYAAINQVEDIMRKKRQLSSVDPYATSLDSHRVPTKRTRANSEDSHSVEQSPSESASDEEEYDPLSFF